MTHADQISESHNHGHFVSEEGLFLGGAVCGSQYPVSSFCLLSLVVEGGGAGRTMVCHSFPGGEGGGGTLTAQSMHERYGKEGCSECACLNHLHGGVLGVRMFESLALLVEMVNLFS